MSQQLQIEVINVGTPVSAPNGRGGFYHSIELAYKNNGRVMGRKIVDFVSQDVYKTLLAAKSGDKFSVTSEKTEKGFNWTAIGGPGEEPVPAEPNATPEPERLPARGRPSSEKTYETPEERATRQAIVTRLACVNAAIEYAKQLGGEVIDAEAFQKSILTRAQVFETFIYDGLAARATAVKATSDSLKKAS